MQVPVMHNIIGPPVHSVALAILFTTLSEYIFDPQAELWSELLCWLLLPLLFKTLRRLDKSHCVERPLDARLRKTASPQSLWIFAFSMTTFTLYKNECGFVGLYPLLGPLLLATQTISQSNMTSDVTHRRPSMRFVCVTAAVGIYVTSILLFDDFIRRDALLSTIAVSALYLLYMFLLPRTGNRYLPSILDFEDASVGLAKRIIFLLVCAIGSQTIFLGMAPKWTAEGLIMAMLKMLSWYFTTQTAQHTTWIIAPFIGSTAVLFAYLIVYPTSLIQQSLIVMGSIMSLGQVVCLLPPDIASRHKVWILSLFPVLILLTNTWTLEKHRSDAYSTYLNLTNHPVEILIEGGKLQFNEMLERQSKTYTEAADTYRLRYKVNPPPGFEAWYDFAKSHESPIIDDFDALYSSISSLWRLNGTQVNDIMNLAYAQPQSELWLCEFKGVTGRTTCQHPWRQNDRHISLLFNRLLSDLKGVIPDVRFLVNHLDEPRVLIPQDSEEFNMTDLSHRSSWTTITRSCGKLPSNVSADTSIDTFGLPFVVSLASSSDLCQHLEYSSMHGLLQSPTSFRPISGLVPVLSTGTLHGMGDILFPSPAYIEKEFRYEADKDVEWEHKRDAVFWAGSTTGGYAATPSWRNFHRQRFVALTQGLDKTLHTYLRKRDGLLKPVESAFLNRQFYNVAFTKISQCSKPTCRDQAAYFRTKPHTDRNRALHSRFAFDMDGNGISGRYYQLLASKSVVMKQTLLREWHDDRLVPWVHYIPVSLSMKELPELVSWLVWSELGQKRAREIGERGREWYSKALREVDRSVYMYRMMVELARLRDPDRQAI